MRRSDIQPVGCLLLGESDRISALGRILTSQDVRISLPGADRNLLYSAQEGLFAARLPGGACIAAEGEMCWAALAVAALLSVERVALIAPREPGQNTERDRQLVRLRGFARRNLFFCVADVLVLEDGHSMDATLRRLCNARVRRADLRDQRWTNCEYSPIYAAARFLKDGDFEIALAK